jgi:hypothetical protein
MDLRRILSREALAAALSWRPTARTTDLLLVPKMQNWVQQLWNSHSSAVFPSHPCKFVGVGIQDTSSTSECCVFSRLRVGEHFATLCGEPATGGFFKFWKNLPPVTVYPLWIASSSQRWNSCDPHSLFYTWQVHNSTFLYSQISPYTTTAIYGIIYTR